MVVMQFFLIFFLTADLGESAQRSETHTKNATALRVRTAAPVCTVSGASAGGGGDGRGGLARGKQRQSSET